MLQTLDKSQKWYLFIVYMPQIYNLEAKNVYLSQPTFRNLVVKPFLLKWGSTQRRFLEHAMGASIYIVRTEEGEKLTKSEVK